MTINRTLTNVYTITDDGVVTVTLTSVLRSANNGEGFVLTVTLEENGQTCTRKYTSSNENYDRERLTISDAVKEIILYNGDIHKVLGPQDGE